jgi:hypothetical protein
MLIHEFFQQATAMRAQCASVHQDRGKGLRAIHGRHIHRLDQSIATDEAHLDCEKSEQQVAVGVRFGHGGFSELRRLRGSAEDVSSRRVGADDRDRVV